MTPVLAEGIPVKNGIRATVALRQQQFAPLNMIGYSP
jgi:hypothetical protein